MTEQRVCKLELGKFLLHNINFLKQHEPEKQSCISCRSLTLVLYTHSLCQLSHIRPSLDNVTSTEQHYKWLRAVQRLIKIFAVVDPAGS